MLVPNEKNTHNDVKQLHPITIHTILAGEGSKACTVVNVADDATVADVIDVVLDNQTIVAGAELFDLCEVYSELSIFPTDPDVLLETSRRLNYSEYPLSVVQSWVKSDDTTIETENIVNGVNCESTSVVKKNADEHYRLYLTQKKGMNKHGDVKITWLDGLDSKRTADEWHFDPFYREKNEIDDLVKLPILNENVLLDELCKRFCKGRIYTYVGGILIAINPFKYFPIYNPKYVNAYQHRKLGELPPHVFAMADAAYLRMLRDKQNQCIVISGESGSGKTESTKLILHHLTALSHKTKASLLEKTILAAGPVLEAFGNAKTYYNNNSSRFGKFTQINYRKDGVVCGAVLKKYLLEKSRIVAQSPNERNYHVFYCLLAGSSLTERESLHLKDPKHYYYLNQTNCYAIDGVDEAYEFARLKNAIKNIGIHSGIQQRMFAVLSAVLHIGNISFKKRNYPDEAVSVENEEIIDTVAQLLQVEKQELIQPLTMRKTITRGEEFVRMYKYDEAVATRDSMAKCLYASLFDWIVLQTNHIMVNRQERKSENKAYSIGVLDIFGFEDFEANSFEQFCINLANENLQYYLNQHIFKLRQDEYIEEGLSWDHVDYVDNVTCLNLMVGRPTGLILLLDEECSLTIGTDESLLEKFNRHHVNNPCYEMPPTSQPVFSIVHYAGTVIYKIKDFRSKNRDLMRSDIVTAFKNSRMLFMRELMGSDPIAIYYWSILRHVVKAVSMFKRAGEARAKGQKMFKRDESVNWASNTPPSRRRSFLRQLTVAEPDPGQQESIKRATRVMNKRVHDLKMKIQSPARVRSGLEVRRKMTEVKGRGGLKSPPTVVAQFQSSLQELMDTLNASHPFFIRCIRSNAQKAPLEFDAELVLRQLRYTGMLETVKIRQAGYPCRILLEDFYSQFKLLFSSKNFNDHSDNLPKLLSTVGLDPDQFQVGSTKVFMREQQYQTLRLQLQKKVDENARLIQSWVRAQLQRSRFLQTKDAVIRIQKIWRGYQCRLIYQEKLRRYYAVLNIQKFWRATKKVKFAKTYFPQFKSKVIRLQSCWRGYICRKRYLKMIEDKREAEEQQEITQNAENIMKEVLKDTIFRQSFEPDDINITDTDFTSVTSSPIQSPNVNTKQTVPIYEEITKYAEIFANQTKPVEQKQAAVVKLREKDKDKDTPENLKQKLYRRLSFNTKDKRQLTPHLKKAKEAEDGYEIISQSESAIDYKKNTLNNSRINLSVATPTSTKTHDSNKSSGFSSFINSLHRKGSKRESNKSDKKARRGSNAGDNEYIVNGEIELEIFNSFLMKKVTDMNKADRGKQDTEVDVVFKNALHKYHGNLLFTCADASIQRKENILLKFIDLVNGFQEVLDQIVNQDEKVSKEFSVMGCNLFRGIIEEFQKNKDKLVMKRKQHKPYKARKRRKTLELYEHKGHLYTFQNFNIRTYCEYCNSFIYDRGLTCQACNFTCHKKCHTKYGRTCKGRRPSLCGPSALFGTDLSEITSPNNPIPQAVIMLMLELEKRGLYAVGLYRKSGLQAAINNLKSVLTSTDADDLLLEDERPHTLSSLLKLFFRQLPQPVIPQSFYEDFMRCTDLENDVEMHSTMYVLIQKFPKANRELLERLVIHLSRVAKLEEHNKMSPNALAIIWAPCLMRCPDDIDPFESLKHVPKQTKCLEVLIDIQLKSGLYILNDIDALHRAASTAEKRLDFIMNERKLRGTTDMTDDASISSSRRESINTYEIEMLQKEINDMNDERMMLTANLANIQLCKTQSMDSLDDLGSENDFEIIRGGSYEDITDTEEKLKKSSIEQRRLKFASSGHESSYEDITDLKLSE